ncbi:MAG TPA: hypothetical protein VMZ27_14195, partial [Candidatus Saccharimonadales bacterium]|nr:hypothetical protein [Candidatus Saccharimonadales bacterium]
MSTSPAPKPLPKNEPRSVPQPRWPQDASSVTSRHLRFGWWSLLIFLTLGLALETLHGFKVSAYLNLSNETRRLMWTLAHAHGTLLALVHLGFAFTVRMLPDWSPKTRSMASACFIGSGILMPAGFFLGGVFVYSGDPGLGILLVPFGGVMLFAAVLQTAMGLRSLVRDADES